MRYLVKNGLDYRVRGEPVRREPGDIADDIPVRSVEWLLRQGHIEKIEEDEGGDD